MFASIAEPDRLKQAMLAFGADIKCEVVHIWPEQFHQMMDTMASTYFRPATAGAPRSEE